MYFLETLLRIISQWLSLLSASVLMYIYIFKANWLETIWFCSSDMPISFLPPPPPGMLSVIPPWEEGSASCVVSARVGLAAPAAAYSVHSPPVFPFAHLVEVRCWVLCQKELETMLPRCAKLTTRVPLAQ